MIASPSQLDILWKGFHAISKDLAWRDDDFYMTLDNICDNLIFLKKLHHNHTELRENMKLMAIIKVYGNIYKYDGTKMKNGQLKHGKETNQLKGLYGFVELMIVRSFYNTLMRAKNKTKMHTGVGNNVCVHGNEMDIEGHVENSGNHAIQLASIVHVDIDNEIDDEARLARAAEFNRKLDTLEGKHVKR